MNILITNDDGVHGMGLTHLARELGREHSLTIVAPDRERSGMSHALTLDQPLLAKRVEGAPDGVRMFAVSGTPVDCVRLGLGTLCEDPVDLVIAGINNGGNLGGDISYSGTVHAALEGCVCGVPSIALSLRVPPLPQPIGEMGRAFAAAARCSRQIVDQLALRDLNGVIYNINFPLDIASMPPRIMVCPQGESAYDTVYHEHQDSFGRTFYWVGATPARSTYNEEHKTDVYWSALGYATLTPLRWNLTASDRLEQAGRLAANVELICAVEEADK